uniref:Uncharacterized protein n=1 Tax=Chenopodium quinoa TaxID=63459 RepID=A0A803MNS9_CHEQI
MTKNMKVGHVLLFMVAIVVVGTVTQPTLAVRRTPLTANTIQQNPLSNIMLETVNNGAAGWCQQRNEICNAYFKCCPDLVCYTRGTCGDLV